MTGEKEYTAEEFSLLVNRKVRTLYMWRRRGILVPRKDITGHYIYTESDYKKARSLLGLDVEVQEQEG